jgi:hypothetical protein
MIRKNTCVAPVLAVIFVIAAAHQAAGQGASNPGLIVDGKPFVIHGVTYPKKPDEADFKKMTDLGVNAIRTWGTGEHTAALLDMAQRYHIKVMLGIWMRHGRPGAEGDDSFDWVSNEAGKQKQMDSALAAIAQFKDHPAVLCWGIGNEVTLNIATEPEKIAYAKYLEKICAAAKKLDPKHSIASVSAWTTDVPYWRDYVPSLDIYGVNVYGYSVYAIPGELAKLKAQKPFLLGEFGVSGEWEAKPDANGVKPEPDDQQKYDIYAKGWADVAAKSGPQFLGGFLFNFGNELSFAGIWLDFFSGDAYRPSYWGARKAFTGKEPINHPPAIDTFLLRDANDPHAPGSWVDAKLQVTDAEKDPFKVSFYYNQRVGDRANRDAVRPLKSEPGAKPGFYRVQLPDLTGGVKIYAFVEDTYPNLSIASTSINMGKAPAAK